MCISPFMTLRGSKLIYELKEVYHHAGSLIDEWPRSLIILGADSFREFVIVIIDRT